MNKNRLEAFSDGVIAILITIMVLELKVPHEASLESLLPVLPIFGCYLLSYVYLGIYWNNHHHMFHAAKKVSAGILWWNLILLFWLSLVPFATSWMGENHFASVPVALYGVILLLSAISYTLLQRAIIAVHGPESLIKKAVGEDRKGHLSLVLYISAIGFSFVLPILSCALYLLVALIWLIPDRRIEDAWNSEMAKKKTGE